MNFYFIFFSLSFTYYLSFSFIHYLSYYLSLILFSSISCPFIEHWLYPVAHMWRDHTHINSYRARVQLCFKLRLPSHCGALGVEVKGFRLASTRLGLATCCAFPELPQSAYASFTHTLIYIIYSIYRHVRAHAWAPTHTQPHTHTQRCSQHMRP